MGGEEVEGGEEVGVDFLMLFEEGVASGEAGVRPSAPGSRLEEVQGDFIEADQDAVKFFRAEVRTRDMAAMSRRSS